MKASIEQKLQKIMERSEEITALLADPAVINQPTQYRDLTIELAQLEPITTTFKAYQAVLNAQQEASALLKDTDTDMQALAQEEWQQAELKKQQLEQQLQIHLLPKDPDDSHNTFLEIRAGTGGAEAALFAGNLARMYLYYAEQQHWQTEILSHSDGEHGGYKEIIIRIIGPNVYSRLKFESGAHRVQRVPETEAQGRVHTSACTVAVLPEVEAIDHIDINPNDLRVDTYRASGAGGQHVNKTDSAIRLTHLPTGIVVECQDERSQHKNRSRAMSLLAAKLLAAEREKQTTAQAQTRRQLVGSGDRSERIRTYNFPQGRLTDHRINLTLYQLDSILNGQLDLVINPLIHEYQADQLAALGD